MTKSPSSTGNLWNESKFSKELTKWLKARNADVLNITGSHYQRAGVSDLWIAHALLPQKQLWCELKVGRNTLKPAQALWMRNCESREVQACCLRLIIGTAGAANVARFPAAQLEELAWETNKPNFQTSSFGKTPLDAFRAACNTWWRYHIDEGRFP